jgi:exocyst complex component 8
MSDATREVIVAWIEEETTAFAETFAAKALGGGVCGGVARMPRASAAVLLALGHADAMPGDLGGRESVFDGVAGHVAACPAFFDAMKRVVDAATDAYLGAGEEEEEVRLLPIRPRSRGARRSLRTFPVVTLQPRFPFNV